MTFRISPWDRLKTTVALSDCYARKKATNIVEVISQRFGDIMSWSKRWHFKFSVGNSKGISTLRSRHDKKLLKGQLTYGLEVDSQLSFEQHLESMAYR